MVTISRIRFMVRVSVRVRAHATLTTVPSVRRMFQEDTVLHCVSKNVPPLQLAIIVTYTIRLRQFLAQMLPRK